MNQCEICHGPTKLKRNRTCSRECEGLRRQVGQWIDCPVCGVRFYRKRAELRDGATCSYACGAKVSGNLKPTPKGARRSPSTEFGMGSVPHNALPIGAETVRKRPSRGDVRAWVKVAEPNVWRPRSLVVYERTHGSVPDGCVVHHVDHDPLNDSPDNLVALTRSEHMKHHHHAAL